MHETAEPVVRPYWLVDDIKAAVAKAVEAGGGVAHPRVRPTWLCGNRPRRAPGIWSHFRKLCGGAVPERSGGAHRGR